MLRNVRGGWLAVILASHNGLTMLLGGVEALVMVRWANCLTRPVDGVVVSGVVVRFCCLAARP